MESDREPALASDSDQIALLIHDVREEVLEGLLENPKLKEAHLCLLLSRKDLTAALLEKVASHKEWMGSYRVRRALAFHPKIPHTLGLRLVRELYVSDLVLLTFSTSGHPALRRLAEDILLGRLPQLPTSAKMKLARRGPARIKGALLIEGSQEILPTLLDSPLLNEGHVLKALSRVTLPRHVVVAIANHGRWSNIYSVRLALSHNANTPLARVLVFLPGVTVADLRALGKNTSVPSSFQPHIRRELANRLLHGKPSASGNRGQ